MRPRCRCRFPDGVVGKPDGVHELDPCVYADKQVLRNVTVKVSQCIRCGRVSIEWERQSNTEEVQYGELDEQPDEG